MIGQNPKIEGCISTLERSGEGYSFPDPEEMCI